MLILWLNLHLRLNIDHRLVLHRRLALHLSFNFLDGCGNGSNSGCCMVDEGKGGTMKARARGLVDTRGRGSVVGAGTMGSMRIRGKGSVGRM